MENLNAEQVKKGLECCNTIGGCKVCPYSCNGKPTDNGECGEKMSLDALALINKQETEYNELYELCESYRTDLHATRTELTRVQEDNEYLKTQLTATEARYESRKESDLEEVLELRLKVEELTEENERSRAIPEQMKERLQAYFGTYVLGYKIPLSEALKAVNQIAKEVLEGDNEN